MERSIIDPVRASPAAVTISARVDCATGLCDTTRTADKLRASGAKNVRVFPVRKGAGKSGSDGDTNSRRYVLAMTHAFELLNGVVAAPYSTATAHSPPYVGVGASADAQTPRRLGAPGPYVGAVLARIDVEFIEPVR